MALPTQCATESSQLRHSPPAAREKRGPNEENGEQPYCHANATDNRTSSNPVLSF